MRWPLVQIQTMRLKANWVQLDPSELIERSRGVLFVPRSAPPPRGGVPIESKTVHPDQNLNQI